MSLAEDPRRFQRGYYRRVEVALVVAALAHAAVLWTAPPYVPRPYRLAAPPLRLVAAAVVGEPGASQTPLPPAGLRPIQRETARPIFAEQLHPTAIPAAPIAPGQPGLQGLSSEGESAPPVFYAFDSPPRITKRVYPEYPEAAKSQGAEGTVVINANVDERGRIMRAWISRASAPEALVEAALDAVYKFEFLPGSAHGYPVKCTVAIPFTFSLNIHP